MQCEVQSKHVENDISPTSQGSITRSIVHGPRRDDTLLQTLCTLNVPMNVHVPQRHNDRAVPPNEPLIKRMTIYFQINNQITG